MLNQLSGSLWAQSAKSKNRRHLIITKFGQSCYRMNDFNSSENPASDNLSIKRHYAFYITLNVEVIAAIILNVLFLLSYLKLKNNASNMYIIMCRLAMADILNAVVHGTNFLQVFIITEYHKIKYEICRLQSLFALVSLFCNVLHLLCMATDRLIAVSLPHR